MMLTNISGNFMLNNSTTQQLNNSDDIIEFYKNSRFYKLIKTEKAYFVRLCVKNMPFLFFKEFQ